VAADGFWKTHAQRRCCDPAIAEEPLTLVVDASVAVAAVLTAAAFTPLGEEQLVAPALMWSEARSTLHELLWRGEISAEDARTARVQLESSPVRRRTHKRLGDEAWRIADDLGWAKTYDAEYVALAALLGCQLVTLDARLHRSCARLGLVIAPGEL
jgi:predicted nucleic acid-binding protein